MPRLNAAALATALEQLPGWTAADDKLTKTFVFDTFMDAIAFVDRVADRAEAAWHHPDITIRYNRVLLTLTTHDEGNTITGRDTELARMIENVRERPARG